MRVEKEEKTHVVLTAAELVKLLNCDVQLGRGRYVTVQAGGRGFTVKGGTDLTISFSEKAEK